MRLPLLTCLAVLPLAPAWSDTVQFEFSGTVEASNYDLPGAGTPYTAMALFDTSVIGTDPTFIQRYSAFGGALIEFEATVGGDTITLNRNSDARQTETGRLVGLFGRGGTLIDPGVDALDGAVAGYEALYGNFEISPFPGEPDLFTDITALLSGVGSGGIAFTRTAYDTFELSFANPEGVRGFMIADIAEGFFTLVDDEEDGEGGDTGGGGADSPTPVPLPAGALMLIAALGSLRLRR